MRRLFSSRSRGRLTAKEDKGGARDGQSAGASPSARPLTTKQMSQKSLQFGDSVQHLTDIAGAFDVHPHPLGSGQSSVVYSARSMADGEVVALKVFDLEKLSQQPNLLTMARAEVEVSRFLPEHDNVATVCLSEPCA